MEELQENVAYLKDRGFKVGAWIWTFWYEGECEYTRMAFTTGNVSKRFVCPSDEKFRAFVGDYMQQIAACGVDLILFDDDFRYGHLDDGMGCLCENHRAYMQQLLGEPLPENLKDYLLTGGENKYRSAFVAANRHFMLDFATDIRKYLDETAPHVRLGLCACMSTWDFDGISPYELSKVLAGGTKPFLRLIGAPYWAVKQSWGNRLQDVIELERMERSWCGDDAEIVSEGDVYPRPRYACPAAYLEGFDTALRADGRLDGIMKYIMDYTSNAGYETGYFRSHMANRELYGQIHEIFGGKEAVGVRVYESMRKYEHMEIPVVATEKNIYDLFVSPAARMLAACSIPTTYEGSGLCGIAFGENAKYLPKEALSGGLILDARAAEILMAQGIDVGIEKIEGELNAIVKNDIDPLEHFLAEDEYVMTRVKRNGYRLQLKETAMLQSEFVTTGGTYPASYLYENAAGQRFMVFAFHGHFGNECLYRQYTRARQLAQNIKWLSGTELPAFCGGNPDLYVQTKRKGNALSVGLWNFFADAIAEPKILLDREYEEIRFVNCTGTVQGREVTLSKLHAYEFCGFEVK